jgi:hypothetical protein
MPLAMSRIELKEAARIGAAPACHRLSAFGLNIDSELALPGSSLAFDTRRSGRTTTVHLAARERMDGEWALPGDSVYQPGRSDGKAYFTVSRSAAHYRLWFRGYGRYLVTADGHNVHCQRRAATRSRMERFLFAQALPLAAALQGFELLHAGAICTADGAAAFVGVSGVGKTSLVSRLVTRGAGFVTDDVLALDRTSDEALVHPGPDFMAVRPEDVPRLENSAGTLGSAVGKSDKLHFCVRTVGRAVPLRALYYLEPASSVSITRLRGGDARRLLASGFAPYLVTRERLESHLETARLLSHGVPQFRLRVPRSGGFDAAAASVEAHLRDARRRC